MPGPQELMVIAVVALLVFGPDRLPELARNAATFLAKVRNEAGRNVREFREAADIADLEQDLRGVRDELRSTRDAIGRSARGLLDDPDERRERPSAPNRADDEPPPMDPEAT
ncbi:MAG: twin-arginine translocase TatA/TatE family subunit [Intrasporangiaceae bacterium]|nr:twin-arginine translocase TatA/TatE family subunit [Intrasporangiaceae bacterium]